MGLYKAKGLSPSSRSLAHGLAIIVALSAADRHEWGRAEG